MTRGDLAHVVWFVSLCALTVAGLMFRHLSARGRGARGGRTGTGRRCRDDGVRDGAVVVALVNTWRKGAGRWEDCD